MAVWTTLHGDRTLNTFSLYLLSVWFLNVRYLLTQLAENSNPITIILSQKEENASKSIGFYIAKAPGQDATANTLWLFQNPVENYGKCHLQMSSLKLFSKRQVKVCLIVSIKRYKGYSSIISGCQWARTICYHSMPFLPRRRRRLWIVSVKHRQCYFILGKNSGRTPCHSGFSAAY